MQGFLMKKWALGVLLLLLVACGRLNKAGERETAVSSPPPLPTNTPPAALSPELDFEFVSGKPSIGDPYAPELGNTGYDVQQYTLRLQLDPDEEFIVGDVTIDAMATVDNLGELFLDFVGFEIERLLVNGVAADFYRQDGKLGVLLPNLLVAEEAFTMEIMYRGEPDLSASSFVGFQDGYVGIFYPKNSIYVLAEPDGARYWFPNNDHPRDKALFRFEFTVPEGQTAVANGTLVEIIDAAPLEDGRSGRTFIWEHTYPMATYLATVAVGEYERIEDRSPEGIALRHYTFANEKGKVVRETAVTGEAIDWMSDLFGTYPYEEYGYVTVYAPGVSLETQTMVLLSTDMINENTIVHELAHMWFGDQVSLDSWGEMWRNEGFATYLSFVWEYREDPEGLELYMAGLEQAVKENDKANPTLVRNPPPLELFGFNSYIKGALIVHELRQEMGEEPFWAGLKTYLATYAGSSASDEQFQTIMEGAAGKELDEFFTFWLDTLPEG